MAFLACKFGRGGVGADIDAAFVENIWQSRTGDIGEDHAGKEFYALFGQHGFGNLLGIARLEAVILDLERDRLASQFTAILINCELETVPNVLPKITGRAGQGCDHADGDGFLGESRDSSGQR